MSLFLGFEKILMHIIEETFHDVDMKRDGRPLKSKEDRFDDAMFAIFGEQYEQRNKRTADFFTSEIEAIKNIEAKGIPLRAAVSEVAKHRLPAITRNKDGTDNSADKRAHEAEITRLEGQVKKHFQRQKKHYEEAFSDYSERDAILSEIIEDEKQKRESILKALRAAGWSIY